MHHLVLYGLLRRLLVCEVEHEGARLKRSSTTATLKVLLALGGTDDCTRPLIPVRLLVKEEHLVEQLDVHVNLLD